MKMGNEIWRGKKLGVIGGGNMAEALLGGVLSSGLIPASAVIVYDVLPERRAAFADKGCVAVENPEPAFRADAVLLAVKPQMMAEALRTVPPDAAKLYISIMAGIPASRLEKALPPGSRTVRVMPNTPLLVGRGTSALCPGAASTAEDMRLALALFSCGGDAVETTEDLMDAVTALSGSGPAYVFRFAEALYAAGEELGLSPDLSRRLTVGTLEGAAAMLRGDVPADELRRRVTSPGGTTAAALDAFERGGFEELVKAALTAARDRGRELGRGEK